MIGYLRGTVRARNVVDVRGVGYVVATPQPLPIGDEIELHVHTQVREDAITLYGFTHDTDRQIFEALIKVQGVGPSSALALLGTLGATGIADAVRRKDTKTLSSVKGVGPKMADKIVMFASIAAHTAGDQRLGDIVTVLTGLGWDRQNATEAAQHALDHAGPDTDEADIIAQAISYAGAANL